MPWNRSLGGNAHFRHSSLRDGHEDLLYACFRSEDIDDLDNQRTGVRAEHQGESSVGQQNAAAVRGDLAVPGSDKSPGPHEGIQLLIN